MSSIECVLHSTSTSTGSTDVLFEDYGTSKHRCKVMGDDIEFHHKQKAHTHNLRHGRVEEKVLLVLVVVRSNCNIYDQSRWCFNSCKTTKGHGQGERNHGENEPPSTSSTSAA